MGIDRVSAPDLAELESKSVRREVDTLAHFALGTNMLRVT